TVRVDGIADLVRTAPTPTSSSWFGDVCADTVVMQHRDNGVAVVALVGNELTEVLGDVRFGVFVGCFDDLFQIIYGIGDRFRDGVCVSGSSAAERCSHHGARLEVDG